MADFKKFDLTKNVPITYGNSTGVAAQAGDEPMRAAFFAWFAEHGSGGSDYKAAQDAFCAGYQVSPRATADVERDADDEASRGSIEDFVAAADLVDAINACETKGEALGLVLMYRKAIRLATTKPGA